MSFHVEYDPLVKSKDIPKLDSVIKGRIRKSIVNKLVERPEVFGVALRENLKGIWKLRVGDYRVLFVIQENTVKIIIIEHRSLVYKAVLQRFGI